MIYAWLAKRALLGLPRGLWVLVGIAALIVASTVWFADRMDGATETGRQLEQATAMAETLDRVEQGQETRDAIEREADDGAGSLLYDQCLRSARTPANCERFLPGR